MTRFFSVFPFRVCGPFIHRARATDSNVTARGLLCLSLKCCLSFSLCALSQKLFLLRHLGSDTHGKQTSLCYTKPTPAYYHRTDRLEDLLNTQQSFDMLTSRRLKAARLLASHVKLHSLFEALGEAWLIVFSRLSCVGGLSKTRCQ